MIWGLLLGFGFLFVVLRDEWQRDKAIDRLRRIARRLDSECTCGAVDRVVGEESE